MKNLTIIILLFSLFTFKVQSQGVYWTDLGLNNSDIYSKSSGKINCLAQHPTQENIIYAGSPSGGLWKTTNGGETWSILNDNLPKIGVSSIIFTNDSTIFISTGDDDGEDQESIGVYRSVNGGETWESVNPLPNLKTNHLKVSNTGKIAITSNQGLFISEDNGNNYTQYLSNEELIDIEFHPTNNSIFYTCSNQGMFRTTNNGANFENLFEVTSSQNLKISIAVTPLAPDYVYVIKTTQNANGIDTRIYYSNNSAEDLSLISSDNNSLNATTDYYGLDIEVDNINPDIFYFGKINLWKGERVVDASFQFEQLSDWFLGGAIYTGGFVNDILPKGDSLYYATKSGVFKKKKEDDGWISLNTKLPVNQVLSIDTELDGILASSKRLASNIYQELQGWHQCYGEQVVEAVYLDANPNITCFVNNNGTIRVNEFNGGVEEILYETSLYETENLSNKYCIKNDNVAESKLMIGIDQVYRLDLVQNNINALTSFTDKIIVDISPSLNTANRYWFATEAELFLTNDNFNTLIEIQNINAEEIIDIQLSTVNDDVIYISTKNLNGDYEILSSEDLGASWSVILSLSERINCLEISADGNSLFAGTETKVIQYEQNSWTDLVEGLSNVKITDLHWDINTNKLMAATLGRGVWQLENYNLGIIENTSSKHDVIYPNPAQDYIQLLNKGKIISYKIFSLDGKLVDASNKMSGAIDVSYLKDGYYTISIETKSGIVQSKFMKR